MPARRAPVEEEQRVLADHRLREMAPAAPGTSSARRDWRGAHPCGATSPRSARCRAPPAFEPPGMVERQPVGDAAAAVVAGEAEAHVAERFHHLDHRIRHGALGVGRVLGVGSRRIRPAVAGQVRDDQAEALRQRRRHAMPHHVGLRIAVQQQQRRPSPPVRAKMRAGRGVDPLRGKAGIEVGEIVGHVSARVPDYEAFSRSTARQPMSRRQKPSGQRMRSTAA